MVTDYLNISFKVRVRGTLSLRTPSSVWTLFRAEWLLCVLCVSLGVHMCVPVALSPGGAISGVLCLLGGLTPFSTLLHSWQVQIGRPSSQSIESRRKIWETAKENQDNNSFYDFTSLASICCFLQYFLCSLFIFFHGLFLVTPCSF